MKSLVLRTLLAYAMCTFAMPSLEKKSPQPELGDSCVFFGLEGTYELERDCQARVTIPGPYSNFGSDPDTDIRCCIAVACDYDAFDNPDGPYAGYSCLNTYKTDSCFDGLGIFVKKLCPGGKYVQCCTEGNVAPEVPEEPDPLKKLYREQTA